MVVKKDLKGAKTFSDVTAFFDGILEKHTEHIPAEEIKDFSNAYYRFGDDFILIIQHDEKNIGKKLTSPSVPLVVIVASSIKEFTFWHRNVYTGRPEKISRELKEVTGPLIKSIQELKSGNIYDIDKLFDNSDVLDEFYNHYTKTIEYLMANVKGLDSADKKRFVITLVNRFIFLWFLQEKGLLDGDRNYLISKFQSYCGKDNFYNDFINDLFFFGLNKEEFARSGDVARKLGRIRYLNGGLFRPRKYEGEYDGKNFEPNSQLKVPSEVFYREMHYPIDEHEKNIPIFNLLESKDWTTDENDPDVMKISPKIMGYIFEKNINALEGGQKDSGAYYTPDEFTYYLCEKTIHPRLLKKAGLSYSTLDEALTKGSKKELQAIFSALSGLRILDSAVGSGHFPLDALSILEKIYDDLRIKGVHNLTKRQAREHIITENLYGVDIMAGAVEVCQLRMFLSIAETFTSIDDIEPLPNIDYNIMEGNSLIGFVREDVLRELKAGNGVPDGKGGDVAEIDLKGKQMALTTYTGERVSDIYHLALNAMKYAERAKERYRHSKNPEEACKCRVKIETTLKPYRDLLNKRLFNDFLNISNKKETVTEVNIMGLKPFHWIIEYAKVMNEGGFDVVVGNPPWNKWKPNSQEFFEQFDPAFRRLDKQDAELRISELCKGDKSISSGWESYNKGIKLSSDYYRMSERYKNQSAEIMGRKIAGDLNLYKLFMEADFSLLKDGGILGLIIPSGFYTDAGCKGIRNLYFNQSVVRSMYCFENRKGIFKEIHKSFKFITIVSGKGGTTNEFHSSFMLQDKEVLKSLDNTALIYPMKLVITFSPNSGSIMELKNDTDFSIVRKMYIMPILGNKIDGKWNVKLTSEFHLTNDSDIFNKNGKDLPLYEGKMIWQYDAKYDSPTFWINESEGALRAGNGDYKKYRIGFRDISASTNERTMVSTIIPKMSFVGNSINLVRSDLNGKKLLFLTSVFNSFCIDYIARNKVTTHLNQFFVNEFPIPRFTESDQYFLDIVIRAAKLICTTPEFDDLAAEVGIDSHQNGIIGKTERQIIKNEIDAMVAKIYGLNHMELEHILSAFPIVARQHPEVISGVMDYFDSLE